MYNPIPKGPGNGRMRMNEEYRKGIRGYLIDATCAFCGTNRHPVEQQEEGHRGDEDRQEIVIKEEVVAVLLCAQKRGVEELVVDQRCGQCRSSYVDKADDPGFQLLRNAVEAEISRYKIKGSEPDKGITATLQELSGGMPNGAGNAGEKENHEGDEQLMLPFGEMLNENVIERGKEKHEDVAGDKPVLFVNNREEVEGIELMPGEDADSVFDPYNQTKEQIDAKGIGEEFQKQSENTSGSEFRGCEEITTDKNIATGGRNGKGIDGAGNNKPGASRCCHHSANAEEVHGNNRQHRNNAEQLNIRLTRGFFRCHRKPSFVNWRPLGRMAEVGVRQNSCDDKTEGKCQDDEQGFGKPDRRIADFVQAEVVNAAVQEQTGDHDDNGGDGQGQAGEVRIFIDEGCENSGGNSTDEGGNAGRHRGEVEQFQSQSIGNHAADTGNGSHFGW